MQSLIRFSLFGSFQYFNTSNSENYMKLITFFVGKGYKPSTTNELQLDQNMQAKINIMPVFINDNGNTIEIASGRINFQKSINEITCMDNLNKAFRSEFAELINEFICEFKIKSNRLALNYEFIDTIGDFNDFNFYLSEYFRGKNKTEFSVRNGVNQDILGELCNIILENNVSVKANSVRYGYDINTIGENISMRFDKNVFAFYDEFEKIACEIEKGMND
ncbi:MAG: hypothetical protein AB6733_18670 [Clostridiaceae bacterium]